jgi:hypothetical protein
LQQWVVPVGHAVKHEQADGGEQQCVVCERGKKLRNKNGIKDAIQGFLSGGIVAFMVK